MNRIVRGVTWLGLALISATGAQASPKTEEHGAYTLYKLAKAIGEEDYTLRSTAADQIELRDNFLFTDRGTKVPLKTTFLADHEFRPLTLATDGSSSRISELHDTLEMAGDHVRLTRNGVTSEIPAVKDVFFVDGYSPVEMQELMMRFWNAHGRPASMAILPAGTVTIRPVGVRIGLPSSAIVKPPSASTTPASA